MASECRWTCREVLFVYMVVLIAECWAEMVFLVKIGLGAGLLAFRAATGIDAWLVVH